MKGDAGMKKAIATRIAGSADLYHTNSRCPATHPPRPRCHLRGAIAFLISPLQCPRERGINVAASTALQSASTLPAA